jgi:hypothetical protein
VKSFATRALLALSLVIGGIFVFSSPAAATDTYYYVGGQQVLAAGTTALGVSANVYLPPTGYLNTAELGHSIVELDAEKGSGATRQIVEFGITRDQQVFGDTKLHLFASYWINGVWSNCWVEGCGNWQDATPGTSTDDLGRDLSADAALTFPNNVKAFLIQYDPTTTCGSTAGGWWLKYITTFVGCYPDDNWTAAGTSFTAATKIQVFSEVVTQLANRSCSDAVNGKQGSSVVAPLDATDPGYVGSVSLASPTPATATSLSLYQTDSTIYSYGTIGSTGNRTFALGGPGATSTNTTPGNIGSC